VADLVVELMRDTNPLPRPSSPSTMSTGHVLSAPTQLGFSSRAQLAAWMASSPVVARAGGADRATSLKLLPRTPGEAATLAKLVRS
jgi:hypothetical protein